MNNDARCMIFGGNHKGSRGGLSTPIPRRTGAAERAVPGRRKGLTWPATAGLMATYLSGNSTDEKNRCLCTPFRALRVPGVGSLFDERHKRRVWWLHAASSLSLTLACVLPGLARLAGALLLLAWLGAAWALWRCWRAASSWRP